MPSSTKQTTEERIASLSQETEKIQERYQRRKSIAEGTIYDPLNPYVFMVLQEMDRALWRWVHECKLMPVSNKRLLEVGCGNGFNILRFIKMGFTPSNLIANELLPERAAEARKMLPQAVTVIEGDALNIEVPRRGFDIVFQSTVFTSILDDNFQKELADKMWQLLVPGGGVLWYDFKYNNPKNQDVKGVPKGKIKKLFPNGTITFWNVTLAPPIGRRLVKKHPSIYNLLNSFPFLRTHILCWIEKRNND